MAFKPDQMDTKNNQEAEGASTPFLPGRTDLSDSFATPPENDTIEDQAEGETEDTEEPIEPDAPPMDPARLTQLMRSAYAQGRAYQEQTLQPRWGASYNAWNNKHNSDSKYNQARFRGRSRLFRPKTRATARKKQAEAAAALFSTNDVVLINPQNPSDPKQQASADLMKELVNFRLDRSSENSGIPWFLIAMGAHLNALQTATCCSKQYWEYRTETEMVEAPLVIMGMDMGTQLVEQQKIVRDRPRIRLFEPENVIRDPAASWEDQAQDSSYLILRYPMPVVEAREFLKSNGKSSALQFIEVSEADLKAAAGSGKGDTGQSATTRRNREPSGNDRLTDNQVDAEYQIVWLHENFMRIQGKDYVFWSLADTKIVSNIVPTIKAYPEQGGARPVTIGYGVLEPFKIDPMAPVESWTPLQQEINDIVNLRLDAVKQSIAPLAIVRRGMSVDIKAIQNRSPDSVVYVQNKDDLTFDRPGDVGQSAYVEMERLNADYDDLAGNFSTGSVQTNRSLNQTVGGMQLMSSAANALGEFDLRVWIETWCEPVLRQLIKLEQYYESDTVIMGMAAQRAELFQKFGIDAVTDEMLTQQVTLTVNVGLGAADPMMQLGKFGQAAQAAGVILTPERMAQSAKMDAVIDEVFGRAGFKNAAERFFGKGQDPQLQEAQMVVQQMQGALDQASQTIGKLQEELARKEELYQLDLENKERDRANALKIARLNALKDLAGKEMQQNAQADQIDKEQAFDQASADAERDYQTREASADRAFKAGEGQANRQAKMQPQGGVGPAKPETRPSPGQPPVATSDPMAGLLASLGIGGTPPA